MTLQLWHLAPFLIEIQPIKNEHDYREALKEIDRLMDARPNTAEGDCLYVLVTLVEAWEEKHWPLNLPEPVEAILFAVGHRGLSRRECCAVHREQGPSGRGTQSKATQPTEGSPSA